jgi:hypothetical protein
MITFTGFDVASFHYLRQLFAPQYDAYSPINRGFVGIEIESSSSHSVGMFGHHLLLFMWRMMNTRAAQHVSKP